MQDFPALAGIFPSGAIDSCPQISKLKNQLIRTETFEALSFKFTSANRHLSLLK